MMKRTKKVIVSKHPKRMKRRKGTKRQKEKALK